MERVRLCAHPHAHPNEYGGRSETNIRLAIAAAVILVAGVAGLAPASIAPRPLYAQTCGAYDGKLCAADCGKECSDGSCCGWSYYYYKMATIE